MVLLLSRLSWATDAKDHIVKLEHMTFRFAPLPAIEKHEQNGICLDQNCSVIVTAYHGQMAIGRGNLGVPGHRTKKVLSLATLSDNNKTDLSSKFGTLRFNIAHDISFVYTNASIHHKSGVRHSYKAYVGQKVTVAAYQHDRFTTTEARILGLDVPLIIGEARLTENVVVGVHLPQGTSGGAVLDEKGDLLGMIVMTGAVHTKSGEITASFALPVKVLARALMTLDPSLASLLFNDLPENNSKTIPGPKVAFDEEEVAEEDSSLLVESALVRGEVADPVGKLRERTTLAVKRMTNLVAKECLVQRDKRSTCHEVSVIDGQQGFRKIGKSGKLGKLTTSPPIPKYGVWTELDWAMELVEVAEKAWIFRGSVDDHYLFSFRASAEDERCYFQEHPQEIPIFWGGHQDWRGSVACFEQALTDKDFNVVAVLRELTPPDGCLTQAMQIAIYYDRVNLTGGSSPVLLPVRATITAKVQNQKKLLSATMFWSDYRQFRAEHTLKLYEEDTLLPPPKP